MSSEPYNVDLLVAQRDAATARAVAAEALSNRLAEDARLLLAPLIQVKPGTFQRRPHLFRAIFSAILDTSQGDKP